MRRKLQGLPSQSLRIANTDLNIKIIIINKQIKNCRRASFRKFKEIHHLKNNSSSAHILMRLIWTSFIHIFLSGKKQRRRDLDQGFYCGVIRHTTRSLIIKCQISNKATGCRTCRSMEHIASKCLTCAKQWRQEISRSSEWKLSET